MAKQEQAVKEAERLRDLAQQDPSLTDQTRRGLGDATETVRKSADELRDGHNGRRRRARRRRGRAARTPGAPGRRLEGERAGRPDRPDPRPRTRAGCGSADLEQALPNRIGPAGQRRSTNRGRTGSAGWPRTLPAWASCSIGSATRPPMSCRRWPRASPGPHDPDAAAGHRGCHAEGCRRRWKQAVNPRRKRPPRRRLAGSMHWPGSSTPRAAAWSSRCSTGTWPPRSRPPGVQRSAREEPAPRISKPRQSGHCRTWPRAWITCRPRMEPLREAADALRRADAGREPARGWRRDEVPEAEGRRALHPSHRVTTRAFEVLLRRSSLESSNSSSTGAQMERDGPVPLRYKSLVEDYYRVLSQDLQVRSPRREESTDDLGAIARSSASIVVLVSHWQVCWAWRVRFARAPRGPECLADPASGPDPGYPGPDPAQSCPDRAEWCARDRRPTAIFLLDGSRSMGLECARLRPAAAERLIQQARAFTERRSSASDPVLSLREPPGGHGGASRPRSCLIPRDERDPTRLGAWRSLPSRFEEGVPFGVFLFSDGRSDRARGLRPSRRVLSGARCADSRDPAGR